MTVEEFKKVLEPIITLNDAERWIVACAVASNSVINGGVQIDYMRKAIVFGDTAKADRRSTLRQPLIQIGNTMLNELKRVNNEPEREPEATEEQVLKFQKRMEEERNLIRDRKAEIEKRKEVRERVEHEREEKERKERLALEKKEMEDEIKRQEEEKIKRDKERELAKKKERDLAKNKEMLEDMKRQANQAVSKGASVVKIGQKKLTDLSAEDLEKLDASQIEKAREAQLNTERTQKVRLRKAEAKRVDHLARALREEEINRLPQHRIGIEKEDILFFEEYKQKRAKEEERKHQERMQTKQIFLPFESIIQKWQRDQMEKEVDILRKEYNEEFRRAVDRAKQEKIKRAHDAWQDAIYAKLEAEKFKKETDSRGEDRGPARSAYRPPQARP